MTTSSRWFRAALVAAGSFIATSCYYDPYASGAGYYGGSSYGGGGSQLHTTFVYTSNERWLYDPSVYCYYDRHRRCYYDPYLYGYYPVGYCPRPLYGARHPGNWRPGASCHPPSNYRDRHIPNYQNRLQQLRSHNHTWASQVRERNDPAVHAWREQRFRAASNYQAAPTHQSFQSHQSGHHPSPRFQQTQEISQPEAPRPNNDGLGFRSETQPMIDAAPPQDTLPVTIDNKDGGAQPPVEAAPSPQVIVESVEVRSPDPAPEAPAENPPSESAASEAIAE